MSFGWVTLVPTPKSHPFEERRIKVTTQNEPVKIGRAVARTQATSDNAVFDCKVLSRNHAILWYRDGEFWLKDTKSSNGTFVNNEKLQIDQKATGRETDSRRVYSGDIIQFGVEIVENANKVSVVYGCIYAVLQCFNAEGRFFENTSPAAEEGVRSTGTLVSNRKLFQMQQYVLEAQHREKQRDEKIDELMSIISANEQAAETAWKALVNEDRLLARIEALEAQLSVLSNNNNPDKQKEELLIMIDEKTKFEAMTKEMIRRLIEENEETSSRLKDMERSLETSDLNCQQLNAKNHDLETALAETTALSDEKEAEVVQLTAENNEKQKTLLACKERLGEVTEMNMKLSMNAINNESASGLARLLANAVNNGKFIGAPELSLLVNTLKAASYFPPHSRSTSSSADQSLSSDSEVRTQLTNGVVVEQIEDKSVESYLKTILELQAKNRDLEMKMIAATAAENEKLEAPLELSPSENVAFFPAGTSDSFSTVSVGSQNAAVQKQQTVIRKADGMQNFLLMVSLVPLLALIFSALAPIQKRLMSATSSQKSKKETE